MSAINPARKALYPEYGVGRKIPDSVAISYTTREMSDDDDDDDETVVTYAWYTRARQRASHMHGH